MAGRKQALWLILASAAIVAVGITAWAQYESRKLPDVLEARTIAAYPHDPRAFTQGLAFHQGKLYEGTGRYGASSIRRVNLTTGAVEQISSLNRAYFGEGVTIFDDRLFQLTWKSQIAAVYDVETFTLLETFRYEGEGWGLTHNGLDLILSDGSSTLKFFDPDTFALRRSIDVRDKDGNAIDNLNELEYVDGQIWANIWYEDRIARIDPDSGLVVGWINVQGLYPPALRGRDDVANGIAYDPATERLFLTGKNWPQLFEVELVKPASD
jgi:glutamine cyclotransferase